MDITSLPNGKYRLFVKADPKNWLRESNERNNVTWVDLRIGPQLVKVIGAQSALLALLSLAIKGFRTTLCTWRLGRAMG